MNTKQEVANVRKIANEMERMETELTETENEYHDYFLESSSAKSRLSFEG